MNKSPRRTRPLAAPAAVRAWAAANGIAVGERGRVPVELVDRYLTAKAEARRA